MFLAVEMLSQYDVVEILHVAFLQEKDQAVQKRAYKLLAYILEQRKDFAAANFQDILDSLLLGVASSMSAAKRYRLRCLQVGYSHNCCQ